MGFEVTTEDRKCGTLTVIYGVGGTHKTTIIAGAIKESPKGLFVSVGEDGLSPLQGEETYGNLTGVPTVGKTVKAWDAEQRGGTTVGEDGLLPLVRWIASEKFTDVAFDSLSMIAGELEEYCFRKYYVNQSNGKTVDELRKQANGFAKSDILNYMAKEWDNFIKGLRFLRESGVNIYISSHTRIVKGRIIDEELEYDMLDLDLPSNKNVSLAVPLYNMSDNFLCAMRETTIFKGQKKNTAKVGEDVVLLSVTDAYRRCKTRCQMPATIPATFESIKEYV